MFPYTGQGPFVIIPANIGFSIPYQLGYMTGALLCLPISIARDARNEGDIPHDQQASLRCGRNLGLALGWPVYAAAGLPFFILKKAFWEQGEGAVCFLAMGVADDALAAYRALDGAAVAARDPDGWRRVATLADDVARLYAPLDGME